GVLFAFPFGEREGESFFGLETRLSRPASAARLLPTISSPSLEDEGRNRDVGRQRCRSGGAGRSMHATPAGRPARNQSNRVTDALPRRVRCRFLEAGSARAKRAIAAGMPGDLSGATDVAIYRAQRLGELLADSIPGRAVVAPGVDNDNVIKVGTG